MKKTLLISTALVAFATATNAYAEDDLAGSWQNPEKALVVNDKQELKDIESYLFYYKAITVTKDGELSIINSDIKSSDSGDSIVINGKLNLDNSVFESGNDDDSLPNNSNMVLNGANVEMTDSDLEANGNLTISKTTLTSTSSLSSEGKQENGIWADKNVNISDSTIELEKSYISSGGDIVLGQGNKITGQNSIILASSTAKKIDIIGGEIDITDSAIKAHSGNVKC